MYTKVQFLTTKCKLVFEATYSVFALKLAKFTVCVSVEKVSTFSNEQFPMRTACLPSPV
jgi:hypothetical protein